MAAENYMTFFTTDEEKKIINEATALVKGPDGRPISRSAFLRTAALKHAEEVQRENSESEA